VKSDVVTTASESSAMHGVDVMRFLTLSQQRELQFPTPCSVTMAARGFMFSRVATTGSGACVENIRGGGQKARAGTGRMGEEVILN